MFLVYLVIKISNMNHPIPTALLILTEPEARRSEFATHELQVFHFLRAEFY